MPSPLPQLTTILLLVHLGLGCCLHHSHACDFGDCASNDCELETGYGDGWKTHCHSPIGHLTHKIPAGEVPLGERCEPPVGTTHEREHSHQCSKGDCIFIADRTRVVSKIEASRHFSSRAFPVFVHAATFSCDRLSTNAAVRSLAGHSLPRTHLALRVLQL